MTIGMRGRRSASLLALATAMSAAGALPAAAQQRSDIAAGDVSAVEADADSIVVTGQREAEIRAVEAKRRARTIQDSVGSTDVGKLPDQNVAEAVKRLPGISIANDQGEGRYVIIRGVDPNLANVTLNGQTAAAPEPEGRQVKLDDLPSSLIGSVDVVKSLTADRDANAIAGQVDVKTLSAFDRPGTFVYARGALGANNLSGRNPWEADATIGTRLGDAFGIVLSGNYSWRPIESQNVQGSTNWSAKGIPDDFRLRDYNLVRKRLGLVANIDYRPSDDVNLYLRTLYSEFKDNETRDQFRVDVSGNTADATTGIKARGTRYQRRRVENDETYTIQGGGKFALGTGKLNVEASYSKAMKKDPLRSDAQFRTDKGALLADLDLSQTVFNATPNAAGYNPSLFKANQISFDNRRAAERVIQTRADYTLPIASLGKDSEVKFGFKYLGRKKDNDRDYQQYALSGFTLATPGISPGIGDTLYGSRYVFGPLVDRDAVAAYIAANPSSAKLSAADSIASTLANDYRVKEDIFAGYASAVLNFGSLTVIPGVRVEHTKGRYQGKAFNAAMTADPGFNAEARKSYTDVFPGLNLRYDLGNDVVLRGGATTSIGRPNYQDIAPFTSVTDIDNGKGTVQLGNAGLKPLRSKNLDLSAEYYLSNKGLISVAAFYKSIDDPIFSFGQTGVAGSWGGVALTSANVTQKVNGERALVYGVEANVQVPLTFLPGVLKGLGVNLNYTHTGGHSSGIPGRSGKADNYLQSSDVASAQLYYEQGRVALRVAYSYRSRYLDTVGVTAAQDIYTASNGQLDARASFAIVPQAVLFVEGSNLTDAPWRRYIGKSNQLVENERYSFTARTGIQLAF